MSLGVVIRYLNIIEQINDFTKERSTSVEHLVAISLPK